MFISWLVKISWSSCLCFLDSHIFNHGTATFNISVDLLNVPILREVRMQSAYIIQFFRNIKNNYRESFIVNIWFSALLWLLILLPLWRSPLQLLLLLLLLLLIAVLLLHILLSILSHILLLLIELLLLVLMLVLLGCLDRDWL